MKRAEARHELTWFVVEPHDRWYRAVCRFVPSLFIATVVFRVIRIKPTNIASVVSRSRVVRGPVVISWALGEGITASQCIDILDGIAQIRSEVPSAYQVASVSSRRSPAWLFAAQEAGIALFLESIEQLPQLGGPLQKCVVDRSSPD